MNISSAKVDELAERLARLTGEDVDTALARAIEDRLARIAPATQEKKNAALSAFFERLSKMPVRDGRAADEILGYGPDGLPS
jgi:antitoxin VapB